MIFSTETAVRQSGDGTWTGEIHPSWDIAGNTNGGYLLAMTARAMSEHLGRPDPVSITGHFLAPTGPGGISIDVETVREGRTFSVARATLRSPERNLLTALGSFSDLSVIDGVDYIDAEPPNLPPPDECLAVEPTDTMPPPMMSKVDLRIPHRYVTFMEGKPTGEAVIEGWFRMRDEEPMGPMNLILALDSFPPTIFNLDLPLGWTPTVELTCHLRRRPATEWFRCRFSTRFITGGFLEEDGQVWDVDGRFLSQSRQLALVPRG